MNDNELLKEAIELSKKSVSSGGFPVGAILVMSAEVVAEGISNGKQLKDATSHGEIAAIRDAEQKLGSRDLKGATVYSSLEPCIMCFSACYWAGVTKVVFACRKDKVAPMYYEGLHNLADINAKNNRQIEISHIVELESEALEMALSRNYTPRMILPFAHLSTRERHALGHPQLGHHVERAHLDVHFGLLTSEAA